MDFKQEFDKSILEGFTISDTVASWMAYKFAIMIKMPFNKWKLYKLGIIDDKGEIIKQPETSEEKNELNPLVNLIRKVKKLFLKVVPDSHIINTFVALYLLKQEHVKEIEHDIKTEILEELSDEEIYTLDRIISNWNHT